MRKMKKNKTLSNETILPHLEAFRQVLLHCLIALGVVFIPAFLAAPMCLNALTRLFLDSSHSLNYFTPLEVFFVQLKLAFVIDLIFCAPLIARSVWRFLLPALYESERRMIRYLSLCAAGLFITGVCCCLFFIMPTVIRFGFSFESVGLNAVWSISALIDFALKLSVVFGLMFQFPLMTYALIRLKIVSKEKVKQQRPSVFLGILILSALLTPPDIISQLLLALPTYFLFELGLFFAKDEKKKKKVLTL